VQRLSLGAQCSVCMSIKKYQWKPLAAWLIYYSRAVNQSSQMPKFIRSFSSSPALLYVSLSPQSVSFLLSLSLCLGHWDLLSVMIRFLPLLCWNLMTKLNLNCWVWLPVNWN
jgi:hypothetical protein